jgi:uncharacterized membrane protein HdeD (DUF308 family)
MTDLIHSIRRLQEENRSQLNWTIAMGALSVIAGIGALIFTGLASVVATVVLGWVYIVAGFASIILAFQVRKHGGFWSPFIFGALFLFGGVCVVSHPVANVELLTLVIGIILGVTGVTKVVGCFTEKFESKGMLLLSGLISIFCSVIIITSWPFSGAWVIGTFVGVDLIFWGSTIIRYASVAKKLQVAVVA